MKKYIRASEEEIFGMTIEELISYLDDIKYDLKPDEDITLATDDLCVYIFWHSPSLNLNYYPVVQVDLLGSGLNSRTIFHREGTENPGNWYQVIDQAIAKISEVSNL